MAFEPDRPAAFTVETDSITNLKRIKTLTRRIASVLVRNNETFEVVVPGPDIDAKPLLEPADTTLISDNSEEGKIK